MERLLLRQIWELRVLRLEVEGFVDDHRAIAVVCIALGQPYGNLAPLVWDIRAAWQTWQDFVRDTWCALVEEEALGMDIRRHMHVLGDGPDSD